MELDQLADVLEGFVADAAGIAVPIARPDGDSLLGLTRLAEHVERRSSELGRRVIVGVVGVAGSGKSVFARVFCKLLNDVYKLSCCVVSMDGYHMCNEQLDAAELRPLKGRPETMNVDLFLADMRAIRLAAADVRVPIYSRSLHDPVPLADVVPRDCAVVLVEGLFLLHDAAPYDEIQALLDDCIALSQDDQLTHDRIIARKQAAGLSAEQAEQHFARVDGPNGVLVQSSFARASIVVSLAGADNSLVAIRWVGPW